MSNLSLPNLSKFYLALHLFFVAVTLKAQINYNENFNNTGGNPPSGWSGINYSVSSIHSCEGSSLRLSLRSSSTFAYASSGSIPNSNGKSINLSFNYKIVQSNGSAAPSNFGSFSVMYSINDGNTFTNLKTISTDHETSTSCKTINLNIPAGTIPNGSEFKIQFSGTWSNGENFIIIDDLSINQIASEVPKCNSTLTTPINNTQNVSVTTSHLAWTTATGSPTGYRLTLGTTPNGNEIYNNLDVGNVNSYPIGLMYETTYYVKIIPYNAIGNATGCSTQTFKTEEAITTTVPWTESFIALGAVPNGWTNNGFTIATHSRLPGADGNVIFKFLNSSNSTGSFSIINVGLISVNDFLTFKYRLSDVNNANIAPASGSGNFIISVSTDYGITYTDVQTINNDGIAGWREHSLNLSGYVGKYVKIKITANHSAGNYYIGFDDFYIGQNITCVQPENLKLNYRSDTQASFSWNTEENAQSYNWFVYFAGQDPTTSSPQLSGSTGANSTIVSGLQASTSYDFYVQSNCGSSDGVSYLTGPTTFKTQCQVISEFPFLETFETDSPTVNCWEMIHVNGTLDWTFRKGNGNNVFSTIQNAYSGQRNASFYSPSFGTRITKMVSQSFDLSNLVAPKLSFWYTNQRGESSTQQDELRVYYKTSVNDVWKLIPSATYTSNIATWTKVELNLPEPSSQYYIAFEGNSKFGYGITVDNVNIYEADDCSDITIWDGFTWSNGIPNANKKTIINGNLSLNSDLETCDLVVSSTGSLYINDGFGITVNGKIINQNSVDHFIVGNGGNLVQTALASNKINEGNITVRQQSQPIKRLDYTLWSSPVNPQNILNFSPETLPNRIYTYEGTEGYKVVTNAENTNFTNGKGYLFRAPNTWDPTNSIPYLGEFQGVPNNGNINISLHPGSYTSVGNPYPSTIDSNKFLAGNEAISTMYFWTNTFPTDSNGEYTGNNYVTYSRLGGNGISGNPNIPNNKLSVGQGFIVSSSSNIAKFENSMRINEDATFFRSEENNTDATDATEKHRFWVDFGRAGENSPYFNQNLIGYMTGATNGYDNQIDAVMFSYNGNALFTIIDDLEDYFVIQGRAIPFLETDVIKAGIRINQPGDFKIQLFRKDGLFEEGQPIYVRDNYLNIVHDITQSPYEFSSEVGIFKDRIEFIYIDEPQPCNSITIWNGNTWSNGLPDLEKKAVINAPLTLNTDLEACQLQITANGSINIPSEFNVIVDHKIINHNSAEHFQIASGANLIQNQHIENQGEITLSQNSQPIKRLDYTFWSTPVYEQAIQAFSPETLPNRIYTYEGENGYVTVENVNSDFINGKGYLFRAPNTWSSSQASPYNGVFKGVPYNQELTFDLYENSYTSVGNPYPSNIDADVLFTLNPNLSTFYFWTNESSPDENGNYTSNNYATYNRTGGTSASGTGITPNGIIATGQGFIVSSTSNQLIFNNSTRSIFDATFIKVQSDEKHRFWLDLYNENHNFNQILIGYIEGATHDLDNQYDAEMFSYEGNAIYSLINDKKLTIQARELDFEETDVVPVGFNAVESGTYRISLTDFDGLFVQGNVRIFIKDKDLNLYHNLFESDYVFNSQIGEFNERFEIVYQTKGEMNVSDLATQNLEIFTQGKFIHVKAKDKNLASVQLYDLHGRILHSKNDLKSNKFSILSPNVNSSVIIVKVTLVDGKIKTKKVLVK